MGIINWFKEFFGLGGNNSDPKEKEDDALAGYDTDVVREKKSKQSEEKASKDNKIVNINATTQLEVVLVKPEAYADGSIVADHLINRRTVVLNLESTNKEVSRRLLDFLSGVAYAIDGQIKRVANSTFIITPYNVGVVGDILDELENSGVYF
ncbi:MAG: cell division protein SepF [Oscillospiraceae bacterium]|jgi:cell division inhibitor SepF|nr:cell division protein SepF [Oscillospiraceae bacterium]MBQ5341975.1 cell division protein SepF [Oscillospiraceae bacterium]MBR5065423.1 cell division protein SepF [Oscillospiraceae bacterium]